MFKKRNLYIYQKKSSKDSLFKNHNIKNNHLRGDLKKKSLKYYKIPGKPFE